MVGWDGGLCSWAPCYWSVDTMLRTLRLQEMRSAIEVEWAPHGSMMRHGRLCLFGWSMLSSTRDGLAIETTAGSSTKCKLCLGRFVPPVGGHDQLTPRDCVPRTQRV